MKIIPKFDKVLLKREGMQAKESLIIIPDKIAKNNASERGVVIAVGPAAGMWEDGVKIEAITVGERVIFARHAGVEVKVDDEAYFIVQDMDIHASIMEDVR